MAELPRDVFIVVDVVVALHQFINVELRSQGSVPVPPEARSLFSTSICPPLAHLLPTSSPLFLYLFLTP